MKLTKMLNPYARTYACAFAAILTTITTTAEANTGGTGMPWEGPLAMIENSITGPTAIGIGIICLAIGGITAALGDELSGIVRKLLNIVVAVGIGVSASPLLTKLFGVSGAVF